MTFSKKITHEMVSVVALAVAIVTLPYSMSVCHAGLILLILNWLWEGCWKQKREIIKNNLILWPFILFFFLHLIGVFYSEDTNNGWFNMEKKTFFFLLPVILATTTIRDLYIHLLLKSFIATSLLAVIICLLVALIHATHPAELPPVFDFSNFENFKLLNPERSVWWSYFSYNVLSSAIGIHPTYLGLYILFSIVLLFYFYKQNEKIISKWERRSFIALFFLFSFFVLLLSSRAIIIAYLVVCSAGLFWIFNKKVNSFAILVAIGLIISGSLASLFINPISRFRFIQEFKLVPLTIESGKLYTTSSSIRFSLWWLGVESVNNRNWMMGNGTGDVMKTIKDTATKYGITNTIDSYDPHNQFIYTYLALGLSGLICLIACLSMPFYQFISTRSFLHRCFMVIIIVACMTESVFELQKGIIFFSIFYSLLAFNLQSSHFTKLKLSHA